MNTTIYNSQEHLIAHLINEIGQKLSPHAILKGGMALQLTNSPRSTNDIDYVFVPYKSKKDIVGQLFECLDQIDGITYSHQLNSKCLRVIIAAANNIKVQVEANVMTECPSTTLTTQPFAIKYGYNATVIRVMASEVALSHKIAAWAERRLVRDVFDIHYISSVLNRMPNMDILFQRLKRLNFAKSVGRKPGSMGLEELINELRSYVSDLSQADIEAELGPYMPREEFIGLEQLIKTSIHRLAQKLSSIQGQDIGQNDR